MTDSSKLTKRNSESPAPVKAEKLVKRKIAPELDLSQQIADAPPVTKPSEQVGNLAQTVVTGAEIQADQLGRLEVKTFSDRLQENILAVTEAKVTVADQVFTGLTQAWLDAMSE